ncbi:Sulfotransferase [Hyella patelloides LEGE 07179]|uniref:Sulfotransferase n=1 Tax=Hyella patelloides LEGE 07179 TaxID=945734 RepID=A0A563VRT6_9CYAN|nr:sulfotransferase [Hyella patelloides]VEP14170.1 Sulfotransferase [Hyella patelloides LEGE 07179]
MKIKNYKRFSPHIIKQLLFEENIRRYQGLFRVLPDFMIVGAQKAGTTSLFHYLKQHPQIIDSNPSEVHFFDYKYQKGLLLYKSYFPTKIEIEQQQNNLNRKVITGETSPSYLFYPFVAKRIAKTLPKIKIIILLREPIARAYSHYQHEVRKGRETLSFVKAISREKNGEVIRKYQSGKYSNYQYACRSYMARSRYIEQVKDYYQLFNPENILVLSSEEFFSHTQITYDKVINFLGLKPYTITDKKARNVGCYKKNIIPLEEDLRSYYQPYNQQLFEFLQQDFSWD